MANVAVGYGVAVPMQLLVFPMFGIAVAFRDHLLTGSAYTIVSIVRGYILRRLFEATRVRETRKGAGEPPAAGNNGTRRGSWRRDRLARASEHLLVAIERYVCV